MLDDEINDADDHSKLVLVRGQFSHDSDAPQVPTYPHGPSHIPKANTNSSNKVKAAYAERARTISGKPKQLQRLHNQRALKKFNKQQKNTITVHPQQLTSTSSTDAIVFVNGDVEGTPLHPNIDNPKNMPIIILTVAEGHLHAPRGHLHNPSKGLIYRPSTHLDDTFTFLLVPRPAALERCGKNQNKATCQALDALEAAANSTNGRGNSKNVVLEEHGDKYICTGTWARRAAKGVEPMHYILRKVHTTHAQQILKLFKCIEKLFEEWCDTKQVGQVFAAMNLVDAETFTIPGYSSTRIYSGIASGRNVYLNSHTDQDFTFSAVTIQLKHCEYNLTNRVVAYFCFPRLGIAVPLRPGDVFFFNPKEEHCVSSRCHSEDEIYCVSLYLKSANLGLNNNDIKLMPREKKSLSYFNANLK